MKFALLLEEYLYTAGILLALQDDVVIQNRQKTVR